MVQEAYIKLWNNCKDIPFANALFFWIIAGFGYISPTDTIPNPVQPASAYFGIRLAFTIIPAASCLLALFFMIFYKLSGPEWEKKKKTREKEWRERRKDCVQDSGEMFF